MTTRAPSHAGSWYSANPSELSTQLDKWLGEVAEAPKGKDLPVPSGRVIIAP